MKQIRAFEESENVKLLKLLCFLSSLLSGNYDKRFFLYVVEKG